MSDQIKVDGRDYVEIGYLRAANQRARQRTMALQDLLAIIHRDGGQHTQEVGLEQSVTDAKERFYQLLATEEDQGINDACGDALQKLWDEIIVARRPTYGDWEYPGVAYRHLKLEFDDIAGAAKELSEYALDSSLVNTSEFMMGLAVKINHLAMTLNEPNRCIYDPTEGRFYLKPCSTEQ